VLTFISLYFVQYTQFAFSFSDILNGLQFNLSDEVVAVAIGAFGITGVASDEIIAYNYWCLEKGYAAYTVREIIPMPGKHARMVGLTPCT
jgi:hypothetical protein